MKLKLAVVSIAIAIFTTGCSIYNDAALLATPNHAVDNPADRVSSSSLPDNGYTKEVNGRYYYPGGYYFYNGYYYCGQRRTMSERRCDDLRVGSQGSLSYQNSKEGQRALRADGE